MSYPERQPIYQAYEKIVNEIVKNKKHKVYAESEINALNEEISQIFHMIKEKILAASDWPKEI